jgi:tetratricopeptide (TPR) repeat protein
MKVQESRSSCLFIGTALQAALGAGLLALWAGAAHALPAPLSTEDRPQPLVAKQPRSEGEEDRVEALARFATGRTLEQREEFDKALRNFERAARYDPTAVSVRNEIVLLATSQRQLDVAARYALLGVDADEVGLVLPQLAAYLTDRGDYAHARTLYEGLLAARVPGKEDRTDVVLHFEAGRLYYLSERYAKAADQFAAVLDALDHPERFGLTKQLRREFLPEPALTFELFGETFLRCGRLTEATAAFERSNAATANAPLLDYHRGAVALRAGQAEKALASLESALRAHLAVDDQGPDQLLADVLKKLGREKELVPRLEKLHAADAKNASLSYFLADQYRRAGRFDLAEPLYTALLATSPSTMAYQSLAEIYREQKRVDALLTLLGAALDKTGSIDVIGDEEKAIHADRKLLEGLLEAGRRRLHAEPEKLSYGERLALAALALERKQLDTAAEFFEAALASGPKHAAEIFVTWGVDLLINEHYADAAKVFRRAVDQHALPADNPLFLYYLAGALAMNDQTDEALSVARRSAEVKKDSAHFAARVPWILYRAKRYEEARRAYTELVAKFDADHESTETREILREARLALSNLCVETRRISEAEEWLEQLLDEYPGDTAVGNDLGYLWADGGKHLERALRMIREAVAAEPDSTAYRDSLGWADYRLGRFAEAVAELETAARDKHPDPVILDHLGDAYAALGRGEKARDAWRRAAAALRQEKDHDPQKLKDLEKKLLPTK